MHRLWLAVFVSTLVSCSAADDDEAPASSGRVTPVAEEGRLAGMTTAHNQARAATAEGLPPLDWDDDLAGIAQAHADRLAATLCDIEHSSRGSAGYDFGENLSLFASTAADGPGTTVDDAVASWVVEQECYTFGPFDQGDVCTCDSGCGHYTQVVWRSTERVGCGVSTCSGGGFQKDLWVCNYDPPGNFVGQEPY